MFIVKTLILRPNNHYDYQFYDQLNGFALSVPSVGPSDKLIIWTESNSKRNSKRNIQRYSSFAIMSSSRTRRQASGPFVWVKVGTTDHPASIRLSRSSGRTVVFSDTPTPLILTLTLETMITAVAHVEGYRWRMRRMLKSLKRMLKKISMVSILNVSLICWSVEERNWLLPTSYHNIQGSQVVRIQSLSWMTCHPKKASHPKTMRMTSQFRHLTTMTQFRPSRQTRRTICR